MNAITVYGPRDARMERVPKPEAAGDMVVAKVCRTGVCATDKSIYTGESSFIRSGEIKYPCRFGHEWAGVVESVGPDVKSFKPGDRVYADQVIFIPAGCFHALDNRESDEDLCILTFWRDWRFNDAYETRLKLWGKSFKTVDED